MAIFHLAGKGRWGWGWGCEEQGCKEDECQYYISLHDFYIFIDRYGFMDIIYILGNIEKFKKKGEKYFINFFEAFVWTFN